MNPKLTELIDQYLSGSLSPEDAAAFAKRIAGDLQLRTEVELQQSVMDAAKRASQRARVKRSARQYRKGRLLKQSGLSILIIGLFTATTLFIMDSFSRDVHEEEELKPITAELKAELDKNQDFDNVPIQYFQIPENGNVVISQQGVLISVPESAFLKGGEPFKGNIILQYQEAMTGADIVKSGLSTMTGDELLETQGMFSVSGYTEDGEQLEFNPEVGVYIQSPIDEYKEGMLLFDGKKMEDGTIDWQNPEPFNKVPVAISMNDLDFYPENYEAELDEKKWDKSKEKRDSLYLSLDEHFVAQSTIADTMISNNDKEFLENASFKGKWISGRGAFLERADRQPYIPPSSLINWEFSIKLLSGNRADITGKAILAPGYYISAAEASFSQTDVGAKKTNILCAETGDYHTLDATKDVSSTVLKEFKGQEIEAHEILAVIRQRIQLKGKKTVTIPFRYIYHLFNKDISYSPSLQVTSITIDRSGPVQIFVNTDEDTLTLDRSYIYPASVMAFWNPAFDNTNLATREFERRMSMIHGTCNNDVLDLYTENLRSPMSDIDRKVVAMGYQSFQEFADENIGVVDIENPHYEQLRKFYEKAVTALKADAALNVSNENERLKAWNEHITKASNREQARASMLNQNYAMRDDNLTRKNVANQLRKVNGFTIVRGSFGSLTARKNCDAIRGGSAVFQGNVMRNEPEQGEIIQIEHIVMNDFSVNVPNAKKYVKLYAYVFSDKINSYQRLDGTNGSFECSMSNEQMYDVVLVGITKDGYEYFQKTKFNGGDLGTIQMQKISEENLDANIEKINTERMKKPFDIGKELDWLKTARKDYQIQSFRNNMFAFREGLKTAIFPCYQPLILDDGKDDVSESETPTVFYEDKTLADTEE